MTLPSCLLRKCRFRDFRTLYDKSHSLHLKVLAESCLMEGLSCSCVAGRMASAGLRGSPSTLLSSGRYRALDRRLLMVSVSCAQHDMGSGGSCVDAAKTRVYSDARAAETRQSGGYKVCFIDCRQQQGCIALVRMAPADCARATDGGACMVVPDASNQPPVEHLVMRAMLTKVLDRESTTPTK